MDKITILTLDPGNSTGWCFRKKDGTLLGGTLPQDFAAVAGLILDLNPDIVVYESFKLYPGKAQSMVWNSFYPCEVIGVIKFVCQEHGLRYMEQAPSVKKYAGTFQDDFQELYRTEKAKNKKWLTEHVKDAYQHLRYFERYNLKKLK